MLGLLVLYFIGKAYYKMADRHGRSKWGFAILGCVIYYGVIILASFVVGILAVIFEWERIFELPDVMLGLMAIPFGLLAQWGFRLILEKNWERNPTNSSNDNLLDN